MKKIFSILLSFSIFFSSLSTVSAIELELPKSLEQFTEDVSTLINEYDEVTSSDKPVFFTADDESDNVDISDTNRLIVKSSRKIDRLDSINCVSGYNDLYILQFADDEDCDEAFEYYSSLSCVEYVQEDGILRETAIEETDATINEAAIGTASQYQSDLFGYTNAKASMGSAEVTIAVVDTGVQNDHEYLAGRVIPTGFDSVYNESCYDKRGHGTHVAGIIVANTKSNVKIKPYKVIGDDGTGTDTQLYLGIQAAIEDGVDVINLSLTRKGESEIVHEAVTNAYNAGITVVAAAGNDNANLNETFYTPACFDEVICVVNIDANKKRASTSNWRFNDTLSAPGVDILSSYINNTYKIMSGTSMATPFISCCVAYLLATGDYYSPDSVYSTLYNNTRQGATANIHYVVPGELITVKNTCATPEFLYSSGEYAGYLDVEITCDTPGATIMYRTSDMNSKTYYEYTGPVRIEETATISAYAFCENYKNSGQASVAYTKIDVDTSVLELDENGVLVGYMGNETEVEIPDYVNGNIVTGISASAFAGNMSLTGITLGQYITTIDEGAFKDCSSLVSVSASGCNEIGAEAFSGCTSLKTATLTSVTSMADKVFYGCSSLSNLTLSNLKTLGERAFETSGISTFSAAKLITIGDYAFSGTPIKSVILSSVTTLGSSVFENCKSLTSITLPKLTVAGDNCFTGCDKLASVTFARLRTVPENFLKDCISLSKAKFTVATKIEDYAFYGCTGIKSFDFTKVTSIGDYAFFETGLESIVLSNTSTTLGEKTFYNCKDVKLIELTYFNTFDTQDFVSSSKVENLIVPSVTEFTFNGGTFSEVFPNIKTFDNNMGIEEIPDGFFEGCSQLESVAFRYYVYVIGEDAFKGTALKEAVFNEAHTFGENCFADIPALETVTLNKFCSDDDFSIFTGSENVKSIEMTNLTILPGGFKCSELFPYINNFNCHVVDVPAYAFKDCSELCNFVFTHTKTIGIEAFMGTALNTINSSMINEVGSGAFKNCTDLEVVKLPSIKAIDLNAFENSKAKITELNLRYATTITANGTDNINFSEFINLKTVDLSSIDVIPAQFFKSCSLLENVTLNKCTKICEEAFADCTSLVSITLNNVTTIGDNAFSGCVSLQNFEGNSVTTIEDNAFSGCVSLQNFEGNSVTTIEDNVFSGCTALQTFEANSVTTIEDNVFSGCTALQTFEANSVTTIDSRTLENCTALENVFLNSVTTIGDNAFSGCTALQTFEANSIKSFDFTIFEGCQNLKNLSFNSLLEFPVDSDCGLNISGIDNIESFSADSLTVIPDNFLKGKEKLASISFRSAMVVGDYAFYGTALTSVSLPCATEVGEYSFADCASLKKFSMSSLPELPLSTLKGSTALDYVYLSSITELPVAADGSTYVSDKPLISSFIVENVTEIPDSYFENKSRLTNFSFRNIKKVGNRAFMNSGLKQVNSIEFVEVIGDYAFYGSKIDAYSINLNRATEIGDYAFYATQIRAVKTGCVNSVGDYAFANCRSLGTATFLNNNDKNSEITLGKGVFEGDKALGEVILAFENVELPDYFFKNCTFLYSVIKDGDSYENGYYPKADIKSLGDEAFYGCTNMDISNIKLQDIEVIGKRALVDLYNPSTKKLNLPNLKYLDEGAFGDSYFYSLILENAETIKDIPECEYVVIGSDIKEFTCEATDSIICAYEGSVVDEFCTANGLNFKKYDGKENILTDVDPLLTGYDYVLSFEGIGFNTTYTWYACNNPDRSDAVLIETTLEDPQTIDPIALFFDDYEENKYTYFYCVATSTENGNVLKTQSRLCKNIFATIKGTDDTFIDFWEGGIFTHSLNNINTLDNIFTIDGDIRVTPSYSTDTETCYGSGTVVEIMNGDEVALTQRLVIYGDINGDGVVDALDVSRIEKESNGNSAEFSEYALQAAADIDKSGSVDELDYQAAVNKALAG